MYINKAMIYGNLTRDPELRALPSGMNVASFSVATNRTYIDKNGKKEEQTDFHNIVVFGRQADSVSQWLKKGSSCFVEGRLQTRSWDDKDGGKKYRTEIVAERVQFGPRPKSAAPARSESTPHTEESPEGAYPENVNPDDIPF